MIILGGTYREYCDSPKWPQPDGPPLVGSAVRAALSLRGLVPNLELRSAIDSESRMLAETTLGAFGIRGTWADRSAPVAFRYFTPLSAPVVDGRLSRSAPIVAEDETVLAYGMIENCRLSVKAKTLVFDPQQPRDTTLPDLSDVHYDRLAIVGNRSEIRALGATQDVVCAARNTRALYGAEVVVVKLGAVGALVCTADGEITVGPRPTPTVFPIGSGDVFSAAYSWAWGVDGRDPVASARLASLASAQWCGGSSFYAPFDISLEIPELVPGTVEPSVYLAGPFFTLAQRWLVEVVRNALRDLGSSVFSPLHDVGRGGTDVAVRDLDGLSGCQSMLALLDGSDPGTMFEAGFSTGDRPIVGYADALNPDGWKMLAGTGAEIHDDLSTAVYRAIWRAMGMEVRA